MPGRWYWASRSKLRNTFSRLIFHGNSTVPFPGPYIHKPQGGENMGNIWDQVNPDLTWTVPIWCIDLGSMQPVSWWCGSWRLLQVERCRTSWPPENSLRIHILRGHRPHIRLRILDFPPWDSWLSSGRVIPSLILKNDPCTCNCICLSLPVRVRFGLGRSDALSLFYTKFTIVYHILSNIVTLPWEISFIFLKTHYLTVFDHIYPLFNHISLPYFTIISKPVPRHQWWHVHNDILIQWSWAWRDWQHIQPAIACTSLDSFLRANSRSHTESYITSLFYMISITLNNYKL